MTLSVLTCGCLSSYVGAGSGNPDEDGAGHCVRPDTDAVFVVWWGPESLRGLTRPRPVVDQTPYSA